MERKITRTVGEIKLSDSFGYKSSLIWLFLSLIIFPITILLILKNGYQIKKSKIYSLRYSGKWFWLFFWTLLFFPIAIFLAFYKGMSLVEEEFLENQR